MDPHGALMGLALGVRLLKKLRSNLLPNLLSNLFLIYKLGLMPEAQAEVNADD